MVSSLLSMRFSPLTSFQTVQFGWRNAPGHLPDPKAYTLALQIRDLACPINWDDPQPHPTLVREIARKLSGLDNSRFVLLTGLKPLLGDAKRVRTFQETVLKALYQEARKSHPELIPGEKHQILCQLIKGYGPTTTMHWDFKQWPILSLSYEHSPQLKGYFPLLADTAQLFHDLGQSAEGRGLIESIPSDSDKPDRVLKPYWDRMETEYKVSVPMDHVDDIPILILNNQRWSGIMHGAQRPQSPSSEPQAWKADRTLYQIAISDTRFPAQKYASLKFDEHKVIPLAWSA